MASTSSCSSTPPTRSHAALGKTLVAPIITYVPEGQLGSARAVTWASLAPSRFPEDRFVELLVNAGRSLKSGGFTTILFVGESGGNRTGMRTAAAKLNELWKGEAKAFWVDDYYTKSHADQRTYITSKLGIPADQIGGHANIQDTSEMLFVNAKHVRKNKLAPGGGYENSGVSGDPTKATAELGKMFLQIKIDNAIAQAKGLMAGTIQPAAAEAPGAGGPGGGGGWSPCGAGAPVTRPQRHRVRRSRPRPPASRRRRRRTRSSSTSSPGKKRATRSRRARRR